MWHHEQLIHTAVLHQLIMLLYIFPQSGFTCKMTKVCSIVYEQDARLRRELESRTELKGAAGKLLRRNCLKMNCK